MRGMPKDELPLWSDSGSPLSLFLGSLTRLLEQVSDRAFSQTFTYRRLDHETRPRNVCC
jgi:hypothetical protein